MYEVEENLVPLPRLFQNGANARLKKLYERISRKKIKPIFDELKQKDRNALDRAVVESLDLDVKEYLPRIYEGLCEMVHERLELPKMRKKQQKQTVKIAYDQVKASVLRDCLPDGIKQFPDDFYDGNFDKLKFELHPTSGKNSIQSSSWGITK